MDTVQGRGNSENSELGDQTSFDYIRNNWKRFVILHHETRFIEEDVNLFLFISAGNS